MNPYRRMIISIIENLSPGTVDVAIKVDFSDSFQKKPGATFQLAPITNNFSVHSQIIAFSKQ